MNQKNQRVDIIVLMICLVLNFGIVGLSYGKLEQIPKNAEEPTTKGDIPKIREIPEIQSKMKASSRELSMGTASVSGVFYPVGKGICRIINEGKEFHGLSCEAYSTNGSEYNIRGLKSGELDFAISRSDLVYQAYKGIDLFEKDSPDVSLRIITPLYGMPIAVIVKNDSNIEKFEDLPGHRLNIGNPGSGKRTVSDLMLKGMNWTAKDFSKVTGLSTKEMGNAFCRGSVDIIIELLGIPASFYHQVIHKCNGKFLDIPTTLVYSIKRDNPFVIDSIIPGGMYPHNPKDVKTFEILAVLVSSLQLDTETVYEITKRLFHNIGELKKIHPALWSFNPYDMLRAENPIPFHRGALKYFKEQGWR